nr:hypothetical protein SHINE37_10517 [Rhizobiaceae bacterium]
MERHALQAAGFRQAGSPGKGRARRNQAPRALQDHGAHRARRGRPDPAGLQRLPQCLLQAGEGLCPRHRQRRLQRLCRKPGLARRLTLCLYIHDRMQRRALHPVSQIRLSRQTDARHASPLHRHRKPVDHACRRHVACRAHLDAGRGRGGPRARRLRIPALPQARRHVHAR